MPNSIELAAGSSRWRYQWLLPLLLLPLVAFASDTTFLPICVTQGDRLYPLSVELAQTPEQLQRGLMDRFWLSNSAGMLFLYRRLQPPSSGFWMYRTHIPLTAAFINAEGVIVTLQPMSPCDAIDPANCPIYRADHPYRMVLEVNRGWFQSRGIGLGARVGRCPSISR